MKRKKFISHKGKLATRWKLSQNEPYVCIGEVESIKEEGFTHSFFKPKVKGKLICCDDESYQFSFEYYNGEIGIAKFTKEDFETCFEKVK